MAKPQLKIYFDIVSPFAYLACHAVTISKIFQQCDIVLVPAFLGGIMKHCGNTPPLNIRNKDKWINLERLRWAKLFNIPMAGDVPPGFPVKTISVMRHMAALSTISPEHIAPTAMALYHHSFVDLKPVEKPEDFLPVLEKVLGHELAGKVTAQAGTVGKELLLKNTDSAIADDAFGMPWYVATNTDGKSECFWGFDHLGQVITYLGLDRGSGRSEAGWRSML